MGLQKGLILENYATLANVSAWLMIFYFTVAIITSAMLTAMLTAIAIYKPENLKYPKKTFVNKIISLLTFATVLYNAYVLISLEQVFLPVILTTTYGVALALSRLAIHVYKKEYKEFNK